MTRFARLSVASEKGARRVVHAVLEGEHAAVLSAPRWLGGAATGEVIEGVGPDGIAPGVFPLAPVIPGKIICIGRNFQGHAKELGNEVPPEPLLFFKPPSSVLDPGGEIEIPPKRICNRVDHEAEIALVIGKRMRHVAAKDALDHVFGVTLALDITARDLQKKDGQWTRAKGMDTFCPLGPVIETGLDVSSLAIECKVNGAVRQKGHARDMTFPPAELLAFITDVITLEPGDVVLTGTPEGVGPLAAGDFIEHTVEPIGTLRARVVDRP